MSRRPPTRLAAPRGVAPAVPPVPAPVPAAAWLARAFPRPRLSRDAWVLLGVAAVALALRLWALGDRALHHDESLHATYAWYLMGRADPEYHYDPLMHGPLQFHLIAFFYALFGSSPFTARLWSASCGTALVLTPWLLRRQLGRGATYALMAIYCCSPICLYISRFAREDMQYALFTFVLVAGLVRFVTDWQEGRAGYYRWLYVAAVGFILAYAAKESIYLTSATLGLFLLGTLALELLPAVPGAWLARQRWAQTRWGTRWVWLAGVGLWAVLLGGIGVVSKHSLLVPLAVPVVLLALWTLGRLVTGAPGGQLTGALRGVPGGAWALVGGIVVALFVLLYWPIGDPPSWGLVPFAHLASTTLTINGVTHPYQYSTDGLIGGLLYWMAQEPVARGGQPWYYYLFLVPLYEWLVVLFGLIGAVWVLRRARTFWALFVLWWTCSSWVVYGWASEKMPWNALHLVVPLGVLAALGLVASLTVAARGWRVLAVGAAVVTGLVSVHNAYTLCFLNGANPVELMVYVQTSQDVPAVFGQIQRIRAHQPGPLPLLVDNADTWPWAFYLRNPAHYAVLGYPATPQQYAAASEPVLLVDGGNYAQLAAQFAGQYVAFHEVLRWWGPEEYKTYAERTYPYHFTAQGVPIPPSGHLLPRLQRLGYFLRDLVSPTSWRHILQWELWRRPFTPNAWAGDNNQLIFYFLVRKDLVRYLSPSWQRQAQAQLAQAARADPFYGHTTPARVQQTLGPQVGGTTLGFSGPSASNAQGDVYVVDALADRVVELGPTGHLLRQFGSPGSGPGQFHFQYQAGSSGSQSGGIAVNARTGDVYVADTWNERIEEFTGQGVFVRAWGRGVPAGATRLREGEFYGPRGLAIGPGGDVYVADTGNRRIQVFTATGRFRFAFGTAGNGPGQFEEPSSVAIDPAGHVYVADFWNRRIQVFTRQGRLVGQVGVPAWQRGSYAEPVVAVRGKRVYVPDPVGGRVLVYSTTGQPLVALGGLGSQPLSVSVSPTGPLLVSMGSSARLLLLAP